MINGWFFEVGENESYITICIERGASKCSSINEMFMSKVF